MSCEDEVWIVTWHEDDGERICEGWDTFDDHESAEKYIDGIKNRWTTYSLFMGRLLREGR